MEQMKQLMIRLHEMQLQCMGKVKGLYFDITYKDFEEDGTQDALTASILLGHEVNQSFSFYRFYSMEQNQANLEDVKTLLDELMKTSK